MEKNHTYSILALTVTLNLQKTLLKLVALSHLYLRSPTHYPAQHYIPAKITQGVLCRTFAFLITEDKGTIIGKASFVQHIKY